MKDKKEFDIEDFTEPGYDFKDLLEFVRQGREQNLREQEEYEKTHNIKEK